MAVVIPALDARYVTTVSLDEYFVNKDTGLPLANGRIYFYEDANRNVPKLVYTLVDNPPGYNPPNYTPLPNPITLSTVGTVADNNGNNVPIYYFPYDAAGNLQLYYIVVTDQFGTVQETRHAWPNVSIVDNPGQSAETYENAIKNPQFSQVLFLPNNPLTITNSAGAGSFSYNLFPAWTLNVTYSGNGSITITRTSITGIAALPGNAPYTITIAPGLNITALSLVQRWDNNPDIFSPTLGEANGFVSASILLGAGSSIINMQYSPNDIAGQTQTILLANNTTGQPAEFNQTTQLTAPSNANTADTGFVDIIINLPVASTTTLSNVQVIGLASNVEDVRYIPQTVNSEANELFYYWQPLLNFKPIKSYLVGWDFPLNPAQFFGKTVAASAAGANTSSYTWDQTILFQTVNNGAATSISATGNGAMRITATNATQFALIQYISAVGPDVEARNLLQNFLSSNILGATSVAAGISGTISLWITTNANLPSTVGGNQSLVASLSATGKPNAFNGGPWTEITRSSLGDGVFTLPFNNNSGLLSGIGLSGWNNPKNGFASITYIAIVVGFQTLPIGQTVDIGSISLVPGMIPTRPAPQTFTEAYMDCAFYYQKSFAINTTPAQNVGVNTGPYVFAANQAGLLNNRTSSIQFIPTMYQQIGGAPPVITLYSPGAANAQVYNASRNESCSSTVVQANSLSAKQFGIGLVGSVSTQTEDQMMIHWTADARLGQ